MNRIAVLIGLTLGALMHSPVAAENVVIISGGSPPVSIGSVGYGYGRGNDTASTLYLRPLNNAALGPSAFGGGYPASPATAYPYPVYAEQSSGIMRAANYLRSAGATAWQEEKIRLTQEKMALADSVAALKNRIEELEKTIAALKRAADAKETGR